MQKGNTNWNLYKTFVAVYEHKNMSKASKTLKITPTAVGQNMKELGRQLGFVLFTAHGKGVEPTSEATDIYLTIKEATKLILSAESRSEKLYEKTKVTIKIALLSMSAKILVQDYVKKFHTEHPGVRLEISVLDRIDLAMQRQQDLIIATARRIHTSLNTINLYTTTPVFVATKDFLKEHGLSGTMSKDQLFKLQIISREREGGWANFCKQIGVEEAPAITLSAESSDMAYHMTKDSMGVGFLSKETLWLLGGTDDPNLVQLKIHDVTFPTIQIVCGYNGSLTKSASAFIDGFAKFCQNRLNPKKTGKL